MRRVSRRAAGGGFDWPDSAGGIKKLGEGIGGLGAGCPKGLAPTRRGSARYALPAFRVPQRDVTIVRVDDVGDAIG